MKAKLFFLLFIVFSQGVIQRLSSQCVVTGTDSIAQCGAYTWPADNNTYSTSGTYTALLTSNGCDSIVTLDYTNYNTTITEVVTGCDSYAWAAGGNLFFTESGTHSVVYNNIHGCDSTRTLELTIVDSSSSSDSASACGSYFWSLTGQTYTQSGLYQAVLTNSVSCDSIVTLTLTVNSDNNTISRNGIVLTSNEDDATYKWLDCDNSFAVIPNAISQSYAPPVSGRYAVIATQDGCVDTSSCFALLNLSANNLQASVEYIKLYPNPVKSSLLIKNQWNKQWAAPLNIYDVNGRLIQSTQMEFDYEGEERELSVSALAKGVYYLNLNGETIRFIKL